MSWEAFRWTAKSPSELFHVLGPHGVDDLIRQMIAAVWRELPAEGRTLDMGLVAAREVYDRNIAVWRRIKQPTPEAFFTDLQPHEADGFLRQAMVVTWMMMPRTGGREVPEALRIDAHIFDRNLEAWADDNATFTGRTKRKPKPAAKPAKKTPPATKDPKAAKKATTRAVGTKASLAKRSSGVKPKVAAKEAKPAKRG